MIITRAPLRMSFVGGGSDMEAFYSKKTGKIISTSIDKYIYIAVKKKFGGGFRISYNTTENCDTIEQIEHPLVKQCLYYCGIESGVEIVSMADIPGSGSGLGSSSAFTVALLKALFAHKNKYVNNFDVARIACEIEIERCKDPIGKQDQYASALGGLNKLSFYSDESVEKQKIFLNKDLKTKLQEHTLVLYTGKTRSASHILSEQTSNLETDLNKISTLSKMVDLVDPFVDAIFAEDIGLMGHYLDINWNMKKQLSSSITADWIDQAYRKATYLGALGGKIMGAGAGGFFLFLADPKLHKKISNALAMPEVKINFENNGCQVVYGE